MEQHLRCMVFIDGTNCLGQLSDQIQVGFDAAKPPEHAIRLCRELMKYLLASTPWQKIRRYWFGSYKGDDTCRKKLAVLLRECGFEPVIFKQQSDKEEKGVDIALTKEMLVNAFNQNFDIGYLIAGDEDYVGLVNEVKRYGPRIYGAFFDLGLSPELKLSFDRFRSFSDWFNIKKVKEQSIYDEIQHHINKIRDEMREHRR